MRIGWWGDGEEGKRGEQIHERDADAKGRKESSGYEKEESGSVHTTAMFAPSGLILSMLQLPHARNPLST